MSAESTQTRPFAVGFRLPNFCRSFNLTAEGGAEQRPYAVPRHLFDEGSKFIEREPLPKAVAVPGEGDVENEVAIRDLVSKLLGDARYRVLTASNGPTGVALLQSDERIDLLVTKMGLPGRLNGRQVADAGRVAQPELKILFVTGYAAHAAVKRCSHGRRPGGADRPFNVLEPERRVGEMIAG